MDFIFHGLYRPIHLISLPVVQHMRGAVIIALIWLGASLPAPVYAEPVFPKIEIGITTSDGRVKRFDTELAHLPQLRQHGLMHRQDMADNQAMLFIWPQPAKRLFWMKNTPLSLDILFFNDAGKLVHAHQNTTPFSEVLLSSEQVITYAVELRAGVMAKAGINAASELVISDVMPAAQ